MVFRACHAILRDPHAAEDAFQATFLVLARKAAGLWVCGSLGPWLLSVARRVACCARADASRQRAHERRATELAAPAIDDQGWDDRHAILHEELGRLPENYRTVVVLCDLDGLTQEQAARHLGWPDGTVRSRLARGRERLRERLTRRGMAPAVILAGPTPLIDLTSASLVEKTVQAALRRASGLAALGSTASAITLTEGVLRIMFWSKFKTTAAILMAGALLSGTALLGHRAMGLPQAPAAAGKQQPRARVDTGGTPAATTPSGFESPELEAIGKARIEVAAKLRDATHGLWQAGEISLVEYLTVQKRYDEVVADVMVKTDADRVRYLEHQIATLKRIEDRTRELSSRGQTTQRDLLTAELARLDAEYALANAKARARGNSK
jgi:RNA polymerase sigma factor (sigma-70 family)